MTEQELAFEEARNRDKEYYDGLAEMDERKEFMRQLTVSQILETVKWKFGKDDLIELFPDLVEEMFRRRCD
jgi:hypothetical protein